jgi:hypothetical protein
MISTTIMRSWLDYFRLLHQPVNFLLGYAGAITNRQKHERYLAFTIPPLYG